MTASQKWLSALLASAALWTTACNSDETAQASSSATGMTASSAVEQAPMSAEETTLSLEDALLADTLTTELTTADNAAELAPESAAPAPAAPAASTTTASTPEKAPVAQASEAPPSAPVNPKTAAPKTPAAKAEPSQASTTGETTQLKAKVKSAQPSSQGAFVVQVKASTDRQEITADQKKLSQMGIKSYIVELGKGEIPMYRLRIGRFSSPEQARAFGHAQLIPAGYAFWVDRASRDTSSGNP
jgi:cell division septation protein DedD